MRVTRIAIALEKRTSDGDYGSERSEVELSADLEGGDDPLTCMEALQMQARARVEQDLLQSPNLRVRRAMIRQVRTCNRCGDVLPDEENGYLHAACKEAEDAEREARYQERKRAEEREYAQLVDGREASDHGTDDEEREALHVGAEGSDALEDDPF